MIVSAKNFKGRHRSQVITEQLAINRNQSMCCLAAVRNDSISGKYWRIDGIVRHVAKIETFWGCCAVDTIFAGSAFCCILLHEKRV